MNISIVVLFRNCDYIQSVIDNLLRQIVARDEIIIVNDHSDKEHLSLISKYYSLENVKTVDSDCCGCRSHNRNLGAKYCKNDLFLFMDGDVYLYPSTIQKIKLKFNDDSVIAISGNIHGLEYTREQLAVMKVDYTAKLGESLFELHQNSILKDFRMGIPTSSISQDWEWLYMYTGIFAVLRDKFLAVGGFNEQLLSWGGEDVEFAYRLKSLGHINYARNINGVHLSHQRNHIENLKNNILNLYKLLSIYKNIFFELPIKFQNPAIVDKILNSNIQQNHIFCTPILLPSEPDCIVVNYGKNISYKIGDEEADTLPLYGISLPFGNRRFHKAIISQDIIIYGRSVLAIIIQECLRIAEKVVIKKTPTDMSMIVFSNMDEKTIRSNVLDNFVMSINASMKTYTVCEYEDYFTIDPIPPFMDVQL